MEESTANGGSRGGLRKRLVALTVGLLLALASIELAFRLFAPLPEALWNTQFDADLGFRMPAGFEKPDRDERGDFVFRLNSLGARGPDLPRSKPSDGTHTALFLGDSFLNGWGVREEELMPFATERLLNAEGMPAQCFALSCIGYGTGQELLVWRKHGRELAPDTVVLVLYPSNDFVNNTIEFAGQTPIAAGDYFRPYLVPTETGLETRYAMPWKARLRRHSRALLWWEMVGLPSPDDRSSSYEEVWGTTVMTPIQRVQAGLLPRFRLEMLHPEPPDERWDTAWQTSLAIVGALRDEVEAAGSQLLVVVVPHRWQVQVDAATLSMDYLFQARTEGSIGDIVDWNLPERRLQRFFEEEDIDAVLLLEPLRAALERSDASVYMRDGHLLGPGHLVAAREVANWFQGVEPTASSEHDAPVDVLGVHAKETLWLDWTERPIRESMGPGWNPWREDCWGAGPGWPMTATGTVAVPARQNVVLHGAVPDQTPLPLTLKPFLGLQRLEPIVLEESGPFELRLELPLEDRPDASTWVPLRLRADSTFVLPQSGQRVSLVLFEGGVPPE